MESPKHRRWLTLFLILAATAVAAGALFWMAVERVVTAPGFKTRLERACTDYFHRPFTIGSIEWRRWPAATLTGHDVTLWEDAEFSAPMLESPTVNVRLGVMTLFRLSVGVTDISLVRPKGTLRWTEKGELNVASMIHDMMAAKPKKRRFHWRGLLFNWITVADGDLSFEDARRDGAAISGIKVDGRGKIRVGKSRVYFPFDAVFADAASTGTVRLSGSLGRPLTLRLTADQVPVRLLVPFAPALEHWGGTLDARLALARRPQGTTAKISLGTEKLRTPGGEPVPSLDIDGELATTSTSTVKAIVRSTSTELTAVVSLSPPPRRRLVAKVTSPRSDFAEALGWMHAIAKLPQESEGEPPDAAEKRPAIASLRIEGALDQSRYRTETFDHVRFTLTREDRGEIVVDPADFDIMKGSVTGNAIVDLDRSTDSLRMSWSARRIDAGRLVRFLGSSAEVTGTCDFDANLASGLGKQFLPTLNGQIVMNIKNGSFDKIPAALKVISKLNLSSLFNEMKGPDRKSRYPFDEARARVIIENGKARTDEPLVLENNTLQFAFMGNVDLPKKTIDGRVALNVLTVADEVIHAIPGVRDILLGDKKSIVPIWVEVKGPAHDPDVRVMGLKSVTAPLWDTLGHIFDLPQKLIDKVRGK